MFRLLLLFLALVLSAVLTVEAAGYGYRRGGYYGRGYGGYGGYRRGGGYYRHG